MKRYGLVCFGILIFLSCIFISFNRLIITDESDLIKAGEAVATIGIPVFYYSNEECSSAIGLWHPPLYLSLIGISLRLFGQTSQSAQLLGIISFFLNLILIYFISKEFFVEEKKKSLIISLAIFLYSINPLIIKSSFFIDIDNSILTTLMTFFLFIFIRLEKRNSGIDGDILLGLLFGGILWAKFHSLLLIPAIVLYQIFNRNYKRAIIQGIIVTLVGWGFFLVSWWIYCQISQLPFSMPFLHNFGPFLRPSASSDNLLSKTLFSLGMIRNVILWTCPLFFFFFVFLGVKIIKDYFVNKRLTLLDFLFLYGILVVLAYTVLGRGTAGFPKYYIPMMPALSIVIAAFVSQYIPEISKKTLLTAITIFIAGIFFCLFVIGDPLLLPFTPKRSLLNNPEAVKTLIITSISPPFFYLLLLGIITGIIKLTERRMGFLNILILATFLSLVSANVSVDILQAKAKYATTYNYGEKGMKNTIEYLKAVVGKEDILICPKDVAYYVQTRFFCNNHPPKWTEDKLRKTIKENFFRYVVFRKNFYCQVNYDPNEILDPMYEKVKIFGDFEIYQRKK